MEEVEAAEAAVVAEVADAPPQDHQEAAALAPDTLGPPPGVIIMALRQVVPDPLAPPFILENPTIFCMRTIFHQILSPPLDITLRCTFRYIMMGTDTTFIPVHTVIMKPLLTLSFQLEIVTSGSFMFHLESVSCVAAASKDPKLNRAMMTGKMKEIVKKKEKLGSQLDRKNQMQKLSNQDQRFQKEMIATDKMIDSHQDMCTIWVPDILSHMMMSTMKDMEADVSEAMGGLEATGQEGEMITGSEDAMNTMIMNMTASEKKK